MVVCRELFVAVTWPNEDVHVTRMSIDEAKTEKANVVVSTSIMGSPVHLAFDHFQSLLYWVNPFFKAVESIKVSLFFGVYPST